MIKIIKQDYDKDGNETYCECSNGEWAKWEYDDHGKLIYYENSDGYWEKEEYDDQGNSIYFENSCGFKRGTSKAESKIDDLINRNQVLETIFNIMSDNKIVHKHRALNRNIKQIPKADTNRYAHWIKRSDIDYDDGGLGTAHFICSNCNEDKEFYTDDGVEFCLDNFCSNCGCKMDEVTNNDG